MFGNLRPPSRFSEKAAEQIYRSAFCGLCGALKEFGNRAASLAANYDATFLYLVVSGLQPGESGPHQCTGLPFRMVRAHRLSKETRHTLSALHLLLMEAKLRDDLADDGRGRLGLFLLRRHAAQALEHLRRVGFPIGVVLELPSRQADAEAHPEPTLESLAEPTCHLLESAFSFFGTAETVEALGSLGRSLGRFLFLWDASVDKEADRRRGRFNALERLGIDNVQVSLVQDLTSTRKLVTQLDLGAFEAPALEILDACDERLHALESPRRKHSRRGVWDACDTVECFVDCFRCCHTETDCCAMTVPVKRPLPEDPPEEISGFSCPACVTPMRVWRFNGAAVNECRVCGGLWIEHEQMDRLGKMPKLPKRLRTPLALDDSRIQYLGGSRSCPKGCGDLVEMEVKQTPVDICPACKGLFLDRGELNKLLESP